MKNFNFLRRLVSSGSISNSLFGGKFSFVAAMIFAAVFGANQAFANTTYANLSGGNLTYNLTTATRDQISSNDNWSSVPSVEGYCGAGLTPTTVNDPQTVLQTEFNNTGGAPTYALPTNGSGTCIAANKGNPSAFNAGGLAEFDRTSAPDPFAIGFQGNVSADAPYMVFYVDTTGLSNIQFKFDATDLDSGSNNATSRIALQYRVGNSGLFTNLPGGFISDVTDPNIAGRVTTRSLTLPAAVNNQAQVQIRLIMTNDPTTPDEWVGINNVTVGRLAPTAASVGVGGRVTTETGRGIRNVLVSMTDATGNVRHAVSGAFGYYRFAEVNAGETYVFSARGKRFSFSQPTQVWNVEADNYTIDFVANPKASEFSRTANKLQF